MYITTITGHKVNVSRDPKDIDSERVLYIGPEDLVNGFTNGIITEEEIRAINAVNSGTSILTLGDNIEGKDFIDQSTKE